MKNVATTSYDKLAEIPLDLAPLLSAVADGEAYSLRVEKLPERGQLSNGHNNGDRTWSLQPDELRGLTYLPPEGMITPHTLEVRVVRLKDDTATTVALHEIPVSPPAGEGWSAPAMGSDGAAADEPDDDETDYDVTDDDGADYAAALADATRRYENAEAAYRKTQIECSVLQNRNRALDDELTRVQDALEEVQKNDAVEANEAAPAREAWEAEHKARLAEAVAAADRRHEDARTAWQQNAARELDEAKTRYENAEASLEALQTRVESLQNTEIALQSARSEIVELRAKHQRLEEARSKWERQFDGALAAAKQRYEAAEASVQMLNRRIEEFKDTQAALSREVEATRVSERTEMSVAAGAAKKPRLATVARAGWAAAMWIGRRVFGPVGRFVWRHCFRSAKVPLVAAGLAGVAIGVVYYPVYAPAIVNATKPVLAELKRDSLPTLISTAFWIARLTSEAPEVAVARATVNVDVANVREGPSTATRTIATVPRHTELIVIERRGNWVLVELAVEGVQTGWIYNTLLTES